jgi:uncharacterized protein YbgA (DUF1722 family)/uncharacterized protein YbbK (DUF523 family)
MYSPDSGGEIHSRPRLAVSSCLLGQAVRYDGRHKRHNWLVDTLGRCVDFEPLCPEVSIGLGIPREPVQLTGDPRHPCVRAVSHPDRDVTADLQSEGHAVATTLGGVAGYVFKSRSPSCGLFHVGVLTESGRIVHSGQGVYARVIQKACPCLPLEEESRLDDAALRENFVNRLYTYQRWLSLCAAGLSAQRLLDFHACHKYLLMAHSPEDCRRLGRLLSRLRDADLFVLAREYLAGLMAGLMQESATTRHVNVLQHIVGHLKQGIAASDKAELLAVLEAYRHREIPLAVPVMCLRRHVHCCPDEYIGRQWYLWPYPDELELRDHL